MLALSTSCHVQLYFFADNITQTNTQNITIHGPGVCNDTIAITMCNNLIGWGIPNTIAILKRPNNNSIQPINAIEINNILGNLENRVQLKKESNFEHRIYNFEVLKDYTTKELHMLSVLFLEFVCYFVKANHSGVLVLLLLVPAEIPQKQKLNFFYV